MNRRKWTSSHKKDFHPFVGEYITINVRNMKQLKIDGVQYDTDWDCEIWEE